MKTVKDLRKKRSTTHGIRDEVDEHPSYGMISLSNVSVGRGIQLFGSGIKHGHFIELKIEHADRTRDKYRDHYFGKKQIISVFLSPAQFTGMLTRTNTPGVPCTINYLEHEGPIESAPEHNVKTELFDDLKKKFEELSKRVNALKNEIDDDLKGPVKKANKEKIKFNVMKIHQDISSNLHFLLKCQTEKLEQVGNQIVAEAESAIESMIKQTGLEHLKSQAKELQTTPKAKRIKLK